MFRSSQVESDRTKLRLIPGLFLFPCSVISVYIYLLNKRIIVQLIFIDKLTVDYPCVRKLLTDNDRIYIIKNIVYLLNRRTLVKLLFQIFDKLINLGILPRGIICLDIILNESILTVDTLNKVQTAGKFFGVHQTKGFQFVGRQFKVSRQRFISVLILCNLKRCCSQIIDNIIVVNKRSGRTAIRSMHYLGYIVIGFIERSKFLVGHIYEVGKLHTVQTVLNNILQGIILLGTD